MYYREFGTQAWSWQPPRDVENTSQDLERAAKSRNILRCEIGVEANEPECRQLGLLKSLRERNSMKFKD